MSESKGENMKYISFEPKISIDGVAIIVACIGCAVWLGSLGNTVGQHTETLKHIQAIQETQAQSIHVTDQALAVLSEIVHERTSPSTPKKP